MGRVVSIGEQDFGDLIERNNFYVDKTLFIKEWWENDDKVTLITRPRRFGKTLNMSMLERFFSVKYEGKGDVFENLAIWQEKKYRELQGTYPVVFLSFADVKQTKLEDAVQDLMKLLYRHYGKKVIILLDEYDTPMQEAYVGGYWEEMTSFMRALFNSTFKTNPYLERAVMTGITRISKESLFSDLNNLKVLTMTSSKYASSFGFTEEEVFAAMDEFGMTNKDEVKEWYEVTSNRESGFGRYDVMLRPKNKEDNGIILE